MTVGDAWRILNLPAQMLSYEDALRLSLSIACLIPLPLIMRRPPRTPRAGEEMALHQSSRKGACGGQAGRIFF